MYEPQPENRHSQSAGGRGGTIQLLSEQLTTYGNAEGGGGGGTIELDGNVLTVFGSTKEPEVGSSKSEASNVVVPNKSEGSCVNERPADPEVACGGVGGPSESESADGVEKSNSSELPSAAEGRREPEGVAAVERLNKSEDADVVKEPKEVKNATAINGLSSESISRVSDPTKPTTLRRRTEKAQPDTRSVVPSENRTPYEGEGSPYLQHRLVGSETERHRETLANSTGVGSSPKEEGKWRVASMQCLLVDCSSWYICMLPEPPSTEGQPNQVLFDCKDTTPSYIGWSILIGRTYIGL